MDKTLLFVCISSWPTCESRWLFYYNVCTQSGSSNLTPPQDIPKTAHAMKSLQLAMKWDEEVRFFIVLTYNSGSFTEAMLEISLCVELFVVSYLDMSCL